MSRFISYEKLTRWKKQVNYDKKKLRAIIRFILRKPIKKRKIIRLYQQEIKNIQQSNIFYKYKRNEEICNFYDRFNRNYIQGSVDSTTCKNNYFEQDGIKPPYIYFTRNSLFGKPEVTPRRAYLKTIIGEDLDIFILAFWTLIELFCSSGGKLSSKKIVSYPFILSKYYFLIGKKLLVFNKPFEPTKKSLNKYEKQWKAFIHIYGKKLDEIIIDYKSYNYSVSLLSI